jgi:hypothetical protein
LNNGEGWGKPCPKPNLDPGQMPGTENLRTGNSSEAHDRLTAREREDTNGSHTLF